MGCCAVCQIPLFLSRRQQNNVHRVLFASIAFKMFFLVLNGILFDYLILDPRFVILKCFLMYGILLCSHDPLEFLFSLLVMMRTGPACEY
jgi:hypothetical protein